MSYTPRSSWKSSNLAAYIAGVLKWTGTTLQTLLANLADSVFWIDAPTTATPPTFDCSASSFQVMTLTANSVLAITNPVAGGEYKLIKKGAFTLTLPSGQQSSGGTVTGTATTVITFVYDGTNYYFNFSSYSGT